MYLCIDLSIRFILYIYIYIYILEQKKKDQTGGLTWDVSRHRKAVSRKITIFI
jgi:hypothetical protein